MEEPKHQEPRMYPAIWTWICVGITIISIGITIFTVTTTSSKPSVPTGASGGSFMPAPDGSGGTPSGKPGMMQSQ